MCPTLGLSRDGGRWFAGTMLNVGLHHYVTLACLLFAIGLAGVLSRRNVLVIYMCLELTLAASTLALVAFARFNDSLDGAVFVFFVLTVAAAEVAVGLALLTAIVRKRGTARLDENTTLGH
ncbi:MAG: NADH-quinone oxidoreductase subunit NuoK [Puniceicoccales bacterium]|nr:NADH-quinone oxidoreductase subunit NuoK [Puniceicoccales bacterium]